MMAVKASMMAVKASGRKNPTTLWWATARGVLSLVLVLGVRLDARGPSRSLGCRVVLEEYA